MEEQKEQYDDSSILVLNDIDHIRQRRRNVCRRYK